jgi:hypothetical protein
MRVVAADQARTPVIPARHRAVAAHRFIGVEEGAVVVVRHAALRVDESRNRGHGDDVAAGVSRAAVHRRHDQDRDAGQCIADCFDYMAIVAFILGRRQVSIAAFIRTQTQDHQMRTAQPQAVDPFIAIGQRQPVNRRAERSQAVVDHAGFIALHDNAE